MGDHRAFAIFYARVMLRECSLRRDRVNRNFYIGCNALLGPVHRR